MKKSIEPFFRFKIGDLIVHKDTLRLRARRDELYYGGDKQRGTLFHRERESRTPEAYIVMGRVVDECHGGIQCWYKCRLVGDLTTHRFPFEETHFAEFEVVAYPEEWLTN